MKAKKQTVVSRSSIDAEYGSLPSTLEEFVWIVGMLRDFEVEVKLPVQVYCDRKSAIQLASNPLYHERTKHIEINCHFKREKLQLWLTNIVYASSHQLIC